MGRLADGRTTIERASWQRDLRGELHKRGTPHDAINWGRAAKFWDEQRSPADAAARYVGLEALAAAPSIEVVASSDEEPKTPRSASASLPEPAPPVESPKAYDEAAHAAISFADPTIQDYAESTDRGWRVTRSRRR